MSAADKQSLPKVPEEITASWLSSVLNFDVKSFELTKSTLNETASKIFVTVKYQDDAVDTDRPTYLCLKGGFNPAMLAIESYRQLLITVYTREAQFFNRIAPKLNHVTLPKVWWAGADSEQGQAIVVMDDLVHKGYTFGEAADNWPVQRVMVGVEQLAGLHACTWNTTDTYATEHKWITPIYENTMFGLTAMWDAQVLGADRPPFPDIIRNRERTVAAMRKHYATKNPRFVCIVHGDPHAGNTFIDGEGNPYFLDWQILSIGSAFHDVSYFVVGALSVEDRRAHEMAILEHYLRSLTAFGGPTLSVDDPEVVTEYKKSAMAGLGWVLTPYDMQRKERVVAMCERYCAAMVDHKVIELVESLPDPEETKQ